MAHLTLRQIEVIRAVMMTGTINGAAALLNVSAPGVSRLMKHTETSLGFKLFERQGGLFTPSADAKAVFDQLNEVNAKLDGLRYALDNLGKGAGAGLAFASVPSIAQFVVSRAVRRVRDRFPDLYIDLNILKIEEAVEYLLLGQGEMVAMSYALDNPALDFLPIGSGELVAILPDGHPLAESRELSVRDLAGEPLIGVEPADPYGRIIAAPFHAAGLDYRLSIQARFAQTVVSLVRHGLGAAVIDEFSVAGVYMPGLTRIRLAEPTEFHAYAAVKKGYALSTFAEATLAELKRELAEAVARRPWERASSRFARAK